MIETTPAVCSLRSRTVGMSEVPSGIRSGQTAAAERFV
jgi:hypothetical protein